MFAVLLVETGALVLLTLLAMVSAIILGIRTDEIISKPTIDDSSTRLLRKI